MALYCQENKSLPDLILINSLWPGEAMIWGQRPGSTLAQMMACCLTASFPEPMVTDQQLLLHSPEDNFMARYSSLI